MADHHLYYPELGEQGDASKLFQRANFVGRHVFIDWLAERDGEARSVFRQLQIRPEITAVAGPQGAKRMTGRLTAAAWRKIESATNVSIQALL